MRNVRIYGQSLALGLTLGLSACSTSQQSTPVQVEKNPIIQSLEQVKGKGILFGHQDDLAYGIDWKSVKGESDVKRVTGDYPALYGWELGGIERLDSVNLDVVAFDEIHDLAVDAYNMGGINSFSWHPFNVINGESSWNTDSIIVKYILPGGSYHAQFKKNLDEVAKFLGALKSADGKQIPFIFRPWHEMDGSWFWWGDSFCSEDEFKSLFAFTVNYLREEKGLTQMVVAYSPDRNFKTSDDYLKWYPNDSVVDILGMDNYYDLKQVDGENVAIEKLHTIIHLAKQKNKLVAFTETGISNVTDSTWFTQKLGVVLADSLVKEEVSYAMVWRNDPKVHFFFPYPGHPSENDAKTLLDRPELFLLQDFIKAQN